MMYAHQCLIDKTNTNNPNFYSTVFYTAVILHP